MSISTHEFVAKRIGYQHVLLFFRSEIEGRGGMLPKSRIVSCHTTAVDDSGTALLCSQDGIHIHFPEIHLHTPSDELLDKLRRCGERIAIPEIPQHLQYVGAQKLTWDQHITEVPARLRYLECWEMCELIDEYDALRCGGHQRL